MKKSRNKVNRVIYTSESGYRIIRANWLSNLLFCPMNKKYRYYLVAPNKVVPLMGSYWLFVMNLAVKELELDRLGRSVEKVFVDLQTHYNTK